MKRKLSATMTVAFALFFSANAAAQEAPAVEASSGKVDYLTQIKPIFAEKCAACHGPLKQESELRLDAAQLILTGGYSGPAIVPGHADESLLLQRVSANEDDRMPPAGEGEPLKAEQITLLRQWINAGAIAPDDEEVLTDPSQHWAYQPPQRSEIPADDAHPIDAFNNAKLAERNLQPAPQADKRTLLRRVYFDLIGLPPTPEQLQAFLNDDSPEAWNKVVDGLLGNPHYGERWGRHWMDVWRYSDWDGYMQELRGSQRHIWRWRDWIMNSLNVDRGYDQMVQEMLAGDEIAPLDDDVLAATGFLARNYHNSNRNIWLDATVEHTAKAFLGMTINCARCHDHKFDPIPQQEYYTFRAIFEPHNVRTKRLPGERDVMKDGLPRAFDAEPEAPTYLFVRGDDKHPDEEHPLTSAIPAVLGGELKIEPVPLPLLAYYPVLRSETIEEDRKQLQARVAQTAKALAEAASSSQSAESEAAEDTSHNNNDLGALELKAKAAAVELAAFEARLAADEAKHRNEATNCATEDHSKLAQAAFARERELELLRIELLDLEIEKALAAATAKDDTDKNKAKEIEDLEKQLVDVKKLHQEAQAKLEAGGENYMPLGKEFPRQSTGRRLALARWITDRKNPLTARVAVNHIWMRHFGEPLVENVFDFGLRSPQPEHAQLLDWLAVELMESNWSLKHLHRLILTSAAWQRASSAKEAIVAHNAPLDPDNKLLWHANIQRLDAEIIRDNVLAVAGSLDATIGGPEIAFTQGQESTRRSIYLQHAYEKQNRMLLLFDTASPNECYRRSPSIIPQQALALSNSALSLNQSRILAGRLWEEIAEQADADDFDCTQADQAAFVDAAFVRMLTRPPTHAEREACLKFLADQAALFNSGKELEQFAGSAEAKVPPAADPHARARESLVHVLMNHNDFLSIR